MTRTNFLRALALSIALTGNASAADFSDPSWPCIQRKVEELSIGLMWPLPISPAPLTDADRKAVDELVGTLALRRVTLEEVSEYVQLFVDAREDIDADILGEVFQGVFDLVSRDRRLIIDGIGRYAKKQTALSEKIDATRSEMVRLESAESPDFDQIDLLEEQLDWDERIYLDRAKSLTYVCETPVLLEKRAYSIAQELLKYVPE